MGLLPRETDNVGHRPRARSKIFESGLVYLELLVSLPDAALAILGEMMRPPRDRVMVKHLSSPCVSNSCLASFVHPYPDPNGGGCEILANFIKLLGYKSRSKSREETEGKILGCSGYFFEMRARIPG